MLDRVSRSAAVFISRNHCISCGSPAFEEIGGGSFNEEPLRSLIAGDPWGEDPMAVLRHERWSFVECRACKQHFHRFILSPEWNQIRFSTWMSDSAIRQFEADHGTSHDAVPEVQHVLRLKHLGVERVLDFGCGFGQFIEMCRLFGIEAHGVDRSNARRSSAGVQIHAELDDVPGEFDAISLFEVLEHLDDPLAMLEKLRSRLRARGVMIVEVPDTSGVRTITDRHSYYKIHPLDHINAFTPGTLAAIMQRAGFRPLEKQAAFVTMSLKRVLKDVAKAKLRRSTTQRYWIAA